VEFSVSGGWHLPFTLRPAALPRGLICSGIAKTTTLPLFCICLAATSAPVGFWLRTF
jgi:hypothetical protein